MSCGHVTYYGVIEYQTEGPKYSLMPPLRISARFDTSVRYDCTFVPKNSCMRSKSSVPLLNSPVPAVRRYRSTYRERGR